MARRKKRKKQRLTPNQIAFNRQVRRLKRAVREIRKQGYDVPQDYISQYYERPTRITKRYLSALQNITRSDIRAISPRYDNPFEPGYDYNRDYQDRTDYANRIIKNYKDRLWRSLGRAKWLYPMAEGILDKKIEKHGLFASAEALENAAANILRSLQEHADYVDAMEAFFDSIFSVVEESDEETKQRFRAQVDNFDVDYGAPTFAVDYEDKVNRWG